MAETLEDAASHPGLYVRALYPYNPREDTSLTFNAGDVIRVITKLDSGWWDGMVNDQRGWFPSNYCVPFSDARARSVDTALWRERNVAAAERLARGGPSDSDTESDSEPTSQSNLAQPRDRETATDPEEASFWIPQVTDDGTLFYFNTLTRATASELPLEATQPTAVHGPRSSSYAAGHFARQHGVSGRDDDTDVDSDADETEQSRASLLARKRSSYVSDGVSPATSMDSLSLPTRSKQEFGLPRNSMSSNPRSSSERHGRSSSSTSHNMQSTPLSTLPTRFLDYGRAAPLTWDSLLGGIKASIDHYREAIIKDERDEFVRRAEAISDHIRLILAAGSGTTDNHSGNPSIITSNRALYPRFRDMMSRFSKLVLDAHINSTDFPPSGYGPKCLEDAETVLDGVYGFVEVARQQRGEEISRLFPGFVGDHVTGGNWHNNGLSDGHSADRSLNELDEDEEEEDDNLAEPNVRLDPHTMTQMKDYMREIVKGMRSMDEVLIVKDKLISKAKHARITRQICDASLEVIELYKPWMSLLESITLAPLAGQLESTRLADFAAQKQHVYGLVASLVMSCQAVGAPLADEWAQDRGEPLEDRVARARGVSRELEAATFQVNQSLQILSDLMPATAVDTRPAAHHQVNASASSRDTGRSVLSDISSTTSFADANAAAGIYINSDSKKIHKIFGQVPVVAPARTSAGSQNDKPLPDYLKLDFDGEVLYDDTTNPPSVKGATLNGLIEQLTRHDTYQTNFRDTFLLTYQSFMSGGDLFELLVQRWSVQPPPGLEADEYARWVKEKLEPIRFRINNIIKTWVGHYWMEPETVSSQHLLQRIHNFVQDMAESSTESAIRPLLTVVEQRMKGVDPIAARQTIQSYVEGPAPKLPKNMKKFKLTDIDPVEFARQLTITESRLYCQVKPHECLNKLWTLKTQPGTDLELAPNVKALIRHSNQITNWVADMVLGPAEVKKRVTVVKYFIAVASECASMYNYSTLTSILAALGHSTIHRLNRTWNAVDKKSKETLGALDMLMSRSKNFANYREALHKCSPPCIPFVGIYLTDLIFIEEGIPSLIRNSDLINFYKRTKTAEVIREIMAFQNITYPYKTIPEIQSYIADRKEQAELIHEMYDRSLKIEPREREDEKIARLLSESGFM